MLNSWGTKDNLIPQEAHAIIRRILILTTLAIDQALSAAGDNHSHLFFSHTLSKHSDMKEYMDVFLFMDFFFFFFFWSVYYLVSRLVSTLLQGFSFVYNWAYLSMYAQRSPRLFASSWCWIVEIPKTIWCHRKLMQKYVGSWFWQPWQ